MPTSARPAAEIHVPIAPTPGFLNRLRLLAASVRVNAGDFADAPIVAWVTRDVEPYDLARAAPWSTDLGVEFRWVGADEHERWGMYGTALLRFTADIDAPFALLLDADIIVVGDLGPLVELAGDGIAGAIAHVSPSYFAQGWIDGTVDIDGEPFWRQLHERLELPPPRLDHIHTGFGILDGAPTRRRAPAYLNLGVIAGGRDAIARVGSVVMNELDRIDAELRTPFRCQLAVHAACERLGVPVAELGLRWNLPNKLDLALAHPSEVDDVRILHYMYEDQVHREHDLGTPGAVADLLRRRRLDDVNEYLRSEIELLFPAALAPQPDEDMTMVPPPVVRSSDAPLEIHVPIAPTELFFTRVHLLAASVRRNAGPNASKAPITVWISRDVEPFDVAEAQPWSRELGVEWRWMPADEYERWGMYGTALARFRAEFTAPWVLMLDADVIVTGPVDELPDAVGSGRLGGVIAHTSPAGYVPTFADGIERRGADFWSALFEQVGLPHPELTSDHTGWGALDKHPDRRRCPHYFNLGVLLCDAPTASRLGGEVLDELERVQRVVDTWTRCQLAVMLAAVRLGIESVDLPLRWNMPNDGRVGALAPIETNSTRVLHYLRDANLLDRADLLGSMEGLERLLDVEHLDAVNEFLQRSVAALLPRMQGALLRAREPDVQHG